MSGEDTESGQALDLLLDKLLAESVLALLGVVASIGLIVAFAVDGIRTLSTAGVVDDVGRPSACEHLRGDCSYGAPAMFFIMAGRLVSWKWCAAPDDIRAFRRACQCNALVSCFEVTRVSAVVRAVQAVSSSARTL